MGRRPKDQVWVRIPPEKQKMLEVRFGSIQAWVDGGLEETFAGTHEAVILRKDAPEVGPEDF
jgi:hypothetical protein